MDGNNNTQAALDAGAAVAAPKYIDDRPYIVVPEGATVFDAEQYLDAPTRKRGTVTLNDVSSFTDYVTAEKTPATRIYGQYVNPTFTAVFNDHGTEPAWKDYRAVYACPMSAEWKAWAGASGRQMNQSDFAAFIENNLPDIAIPPAADMLEISRSLEAKKKVNFASGIRLSNGGASRTGASSSISRTAARRG
jgi:uncharacterized protein YfdQ (DUF2303 family)